MTGSPWPLTAERNEHGCLVIGGQSVADLAAEFGTPLLIVDEHDLRSRCREYRDAFPGVGVAYAAKAWPVVGVMQIVDQEGLWLDVASAGELHTASVAGFPMERVVFHGNNKSIDELYMAARLGVGRVVADSISELDRLEQVGGALDHQFAIWLRVTPGIDAHTHEYVRTGHDDSKFGFTLSLGLADAALHHVATLEHVEVTGVHAHIGSQIFGTDPFIANAEVMIGMLARWRAEFDVTLDELNLGGGMGIRYTHEDHPAEVARYGAAVLDVVAATCAAMGFPQPALFVEPGRAIIGPSTVTVYRVGTVKVIPGLRRYISVDGGMSDNIRPALYGAEHEVMLADREGIGAMSAATVVGKHCESGDLVRERAVLPDDVAEGDLLAVAATGAYTSSMASNYNRLPRPAAVIVKAGAGRVLVRRETLDDVVARDIPLA